MTEPQSPFVPEAEESLAEWRRGDAFCRLLEGGILERSTLSLAQAYEVIEFLAAGWAQAFKDAKDVRWERDAEHELVAAPNAILAEEETAAAELMAMGIPLSRPGESNPENPLCFQWGVSHGSHGGYGRRLRQAMFRSLVCCGIGSFWQVNGELARDAFDRIATKHLGGPFLWPDWTQHE